MSIQKIIKRFKLLWIYIITASSLPFSYILFFLFRCNLSCFSCPLSGLCIILYPIIILAIIFIKLIRKIKKFK